VRAQSSGCSAAFITVPRLGMTANSNKNCKEILVGISYRIIKGRAVFDVQIIAAGKHLKEAG
jgi:hypothetical protein